MPDHFAALDQPRRPWLDADALRDRFHRLSARLHPDVPGTGDSARFAALNAAYLVLREPATRIRHLLELEAPKAAPQSTPPPALGELFMRQAALLQRAAVFLKRRNAAANPLARALLAGEGAALQRECAEVLASVEASGDEALEVLRVLDARWPEASREDVAALAALQQQFAFTAKWRAQLRESIFQLAS